jgi:hypothetical protein
MNRTRDLRASSGASGIVDALHDGLQEHVPRVCAPFIASHHRGYVVD